MAPRFRKSQPERARRARLAAVRTDAGQQRETILRTAEARVKTGDFIARLMMVYTGFATFCVFALLSPDRLMIEAQASLDMPFAGTVSFLAFMLVAPVVLIGMRVYLEVYLQRWRRLDAELDPETEPKTVSPLKHPLLRRFSDLVLYFLLTVILVLFTWKAAAKDVWGEVFLLLTVVCTAAQVYQFVHRHWSRRAALVAAFPGPLFVFVLVGVLYEWELPHRGLNLVREDLEAAYLFQEDLRDAVLVRAKLTDAYLPGANLARANLRRTNLTGANLTAANLTDANLLRADLTGATLAGATLARADLSVANLTGADLTAANFADADLTGANLADAKLWQADLTAANLSGANLTGADLLSTNVTQKQLDSACVWKDGKRPILPDGLKPPEKECWDRK